MGPEAGGGGGGRGEGVEEGGFQNHYLKMSCRGESWEGRRGGEGGGRRNAFSQRAGCVCVCVWIDLPVQWNLGRCGIRPPRPTNLASVRLVTGSS